MFAPINALKTKVSSGPNLLKTVSMPEASSLQTSNGNVNGFDIMKIHLVSYLKCKIGAIKNKENHFE